MKVADIGAITKEGQTVAALQERQAAPDTGISFKRHINELNDAKYEQHIEELKVRIFEQGEVIKKKSDLSEFIKYRKLISDLVGEVASNAYENSKSSSFDIRGKHKVFVLIKRVNARLDDMAQEILRDQSDNIKLVHMVDDIRGLLVDMFL